MYYKIFTILILFCLNTFSFADERTRYEKIVSIATMPDYAPFCLADDLYIPYQIIAPEKDAIGFNGVSWDLVRESFHEMGYTIKLSIMPWTRSTLSVKRGEVDILFPASKNKQRLKIFDYPENYVASTDIAIYVLGSSNIFWEDLSSLKNLTIGGKRGFNHGDAWNENRNFDKQYVASILQGFKMLKLNRFDGFVCYSLTCDYLLAEKGWEHEYKKLPAFDLLEDYITVLKSNPNGLRILKDFDTGFKRIIENGKFEKIKTKWFGNSPSFLNCLEENSDICLNRGALF